MRQLSGAAALGGATASRHILNLLELVISSSATALFALTQHPSLLTQDDTQPQCRAIFASLGRFLERYKGDLKLNASVCAARPAGTVQLVFCEAITSIAKSMVYLLENDCIPTGDNCPSGPLYGRILEVCRDEPIFEEAMPHLQRFYDLLMNRRVTATSIAPGSSPMGMTGHKDLPEIVDDTSEKAVGVRDVAERAM